MTDTEAKQLESSIIDVLTGLQVSVIAGPIFNDITVKPLAREGATAVLDRLRGRGFKVERVV